VTTDSTAIDVLALEPYYGGSHRAFLDGWIARSRHRWTLLTLPAHSWKWRMRHAAVTFSERIDRAPDVLVCSDMLDLAALKGLTPQLAEVPAVAYFHENQLTYPVRHDDPRDVHFALTNMTTALAADAVWFNSGYHRDAFLTGLPKLLSAMPDYPLDGVADAIAARLSVHPPGIDTPLPRPPREPGPLRIAWAARWEHDKNPEDFFAAARRLADAGMDFRLSVLGEQFRDVPPVFAEARARFADRIDHWGFLPDRADYLAALARADVFVATAVHEFFGLAAAEAIAAGARPLLPERLAYPELLGLEADSTLAEYFCDGSPEALAARLTETARGLDATGSVWTQDPGAPARAIARFAWDRVAPDLDDALATAARRGRPLRSSSAPPPPSPGH